MLRRGSASRAHISPYNIQENVWQLGLCPRNRVGAHIAPHIVLFKEWNKYNLGNWSLMFASISGQMALASSFSSHFGFICHYCLNYTKFGQLIFMKIIEIVATRCHVLMLKCTKFDFGWGSTPDPAGELTVLPRPPSWI